MMFHSNMPKRFWSEALKTAAHLINLMPTQVLGGKSPLELLLGRKSNISHLRVFGCLCYVHVPENFRNKLEERGRKCVFLGYSTFEKGYKCYDPLTKKLYTSKDVIFVEREFYFTGKEDLDQAEKGEAQDLWNIILPTINHPNIEQEPAPNVHEDSAQEDPSPSHSDQETVQEQGGVDSEQELVIEQEEQIIDEPPPPLRRSTRLRLPPSNWINKRVFYNSKVTSYPISKYYSIANTSCSHQRFIRNIDLHEEPRTFEEAKNHPQWVHAMKDELEALAKNGTWEITSLPIGKKAVGCKWIYKIKHKSDGSLDKYKARLIAKGFTQAYGIDYKETFAPVAKMNTIRVLLSLAVNHSLPLFQMDVANAFLQGDLEEEVYMEVPPGFSHQDNKVCKLKKAIYGLKQSPRAWYAKLSSTLLDHDFKKCNSDSSLFVKKQNGKIIIVLVYVDDIIITGNDLNLINQVRKFLQTKFDIKDLGKLKYFLGIELKPACSPKKVLSQRKYVLDLLQETGKLGAKPACSPISTSGGLQDDDEEFEDEQRYQRLVGRLIYLTITRPDISFAVGQVSQHMHKPKRKHWRASERILHYLKGSPVMGIWMKKNYSSQIMGYCDADWVGNSEDRRSTTGYCMFVGGNLVAWKSKKQHVVSRSMLKRNIELWQPQQVR